MGIRKEHQWVGGIWARSGLSLLEAWWRLPWGAHSCVPTTQSAPEPLPAQRGVRCPPLGSAHLSSQASAWRAIAHQADGYFREQGKKWPRILRGSQHATRVYGRYQTPRERQLESASNLTLHFPARAPRASHFTSVSLSFPICKVGTKSSICLLPRIPE